MLQGKNTGHAEQDLEDAIERREEEKREEEKRSAGGVEEESAAPERARDAEVLSRRVSALLLLTCFYGALLLLRYGRLYVGAGRVARAALATAPVLLVGVIMSRLVDKTSFVAAVSRVDDELVDEVLEKSLKIEHDVAALRVGFRRAFEARGCASIADLREIYDRYAGESGELGRAEVYQLLRFVHRRRVSKEHFERLWFALNVDGVGEIAFADFEAFLEPAFARPLPAVVETAKPAVVAPAPVPSKRKKYGLARVVLGLKK